MARTLLLAACLWLALPAAASPAASPTETIHTTVDQVIAILKRPDLDRAERRRRVVAVVRPQFDFTAMARATLALYWRRATPAQRRAFVERLTRLLEATYIGRIDEYHDE
ncbi:MAG: ABC transporter substrate-binding protein, partial [Nitrospirae bacterium]